jgi:hypothetical protein
VVGQAYEDMKMDVKFQGEEFGVRRTTYADGGRTAIVLWDKEYDEIGFVATVNLPDMPLLENQTFIKDYSENAGILKVMEDAGIVKTTGMRVQSGFVEIPIAELQGRFREHVPEQEYNPEQAAPLERPIVGKEFRDLAAEIKADEQAARIRDYGEADAATYEQRVSQKADMARPPDTPGNHEPRDAPPDYQAMLDDAALRAPQQPEREGPER